MAAAESAVLDHPSPSSRHKPHPSTDSGSVLRPTSEHLPQQLRDSRKPSRRRSHIIGLAIKPNPPNSPRSIIKSPVKKAFSFHRHKRSGTILRAVPASTACATAPLAQPLQDMSRPSRDPSDCGRISPASDGHSSTRSHLQTHLPRNHNRMRSNSTNALSPTKAGTQLRSISSSASFQGVIGTYRDGKVQWDHRDGRSHDSRSLKSSFSRLPSSSKNQRPRIQVVIPNAQRNEKPLPTSPFFQKPSHTHMRSASGEIEIMYSVSPPSGSKNAVVRDSIVSPLSAPPVRPPQPFHPAIDSQIAKAGFGSPEISNNASNSSDDSRDDASSTYSEQSSLTSAEANTPPPKPKPMNFHGRTVSEAFSIDSPVKAGIFDSPPRERAKSDEPETGHCTRTPYPPRPRIYAHHPPIEDDIEFKPSCSLRPLRVSNTLRRQPSTRRKSSNLQRRSLASSHTMGAINQAVRRSTSRTYFPDIPSPTLSEAENDLEAHLTSFTDDNPFKWDDFVSQRQAPLSPQGVPRKDSVTYAVQPYIEDILPDCPPPIVPRRSSKRQTVDRDGFRLSRVPCDHIASQMRRRSLNKGKGLTITIPESKRMTSDDFVLSPLPIPPPKDTKRSITPEVAENVILHILQTLESLDDLFACAVVNRGFYRVFKRHELDLMKSALRKMSPPAWEHREICYPGHDHLDEEDLDRPRQEYTPTSYIQYYTRDMYILAAIKSLIKDKCQSFMRPEISVAIVSEDAEEAARVDDALWRIWTFCKIFGSGKGREEDIVAQMDWLKGGVLVHQQTCTYSAFMCDDINETLASAPECFAKGNEGGLTAEQLFDMMELWNCLGVLLQPIEGRTIQAREYGIFDQTDVRGGDIDGEEMMLDEWYYYLLTLGLSTVLDLTGPCRQTDPSVFIIAGQNGWLDWKAPVFGGTRRNFLKEAASRVYEDKIAVTYAESSTKEVQRALSKQRIQRHISELRHRKNSGERMPEIRMSQERPISEWEGVINNLTRPRPPPLPTNNLVSHIPSLRAVGSRSQLANELSSSVPDHAPAYAPSPQRPASPPRRTVAEPLLPTPPPSTVASTRDRNSMASSMPAIEEHPAFRRPQDPVPEMPRLEEHPAFRQHMGRMSTEEHRSAPSAGGSSPSLDDAPPAFAQHPLQHIVHGTDTADHSAERAVYRIVEMGFTAEQARQALRKTDLGDGLRVDRAVELLLREG